MADAIGIRRSRISCVERGALTGHGVGVVTAVKIARYFGKTVEQMFEEGAR